MGHIFRCLNLASELKTEIFFLIEDYGNITKIIRQSGFKNCQKLKNNVSLQEDIKKIKEFIEKEKIDIVVLDKFGVKQKLVREIGKKSKTVVISDLKRINFSADLVINGFIGFKNQVKKNNFGSRCLLGPKFQVLNKNFSSPINQTKKYDMLITLGGFDEQNIIETILEILIKIKSNLKVKIILGPATIKNKKIIQLEKDLKLVKIIQRTKNMQREIASAHFGICSGGITSYEFASMGVPFGIISQVKHQEKTATEWEKLKISKKLGLFNKKSIKKIEKFLLEINNFEHRTKTNKIDGKGVIRVSKEILKL